jgi:ribonuclease BN (tRNA processing enzyme)
MAQAMSPPAFPITPEGLNGSWSFHAHEPSTFWLQGYEVTAFDVEHKGGRAYGYRLARDGVSIAYLPDHAPTAGVSAETLDILEGTDVLIHDAQFVESERFIADMYGHATISDAVALAERTSIGRLVLFHHSPVRVDDALDRITDGVESRVPLLVAHEGMVLDLLA